MIAQRAERFPAADDTDLSRRWSLILNAVEWLEADAETRADRINRTRAFVRYMAAVYVPRDRFTFRPNRHPPKLGEAL